MKFFFKTCFIAACLLVSQLLTGEAVCRSTADVERFFAETRVGQAPVALTGTVLRVLSNQLVVGDEFGQLELHNKDWRPRRSRSRTRRPAWSF